MSDHKLWYMYVVECSDRSLYCGITTDVQRRLSEHNSSKSGAKYTRSRRPVMLVYAEEHENRSSALKAEASFKRLTRLQKIEIVEST